MIAGRGIDANNAGQPLNHLWRSGLVTLGVAPFVLCLAGVGLLPDSGAARTAAAHRARWGAVLLAFSGAVHWGLAIAGVTLFASDAAGCADIA